MKGITILLIVVSLLGIAADAQSHEGKTWRGARSASTVTIQSAGRFTPTGSMGTRRFFHTATPLADGRVLISGGEYLELAGAGPGIVSKPVTSAEIYDPATGVFVPTGNIATPRKSSHRHASS